MLKNSLNLSKEIIEQKLEKKNISKPLEVFKDDINQIDKLKK